MADIRTFIRQFVEWHTTWLPVNIKSLSLGVAWSDVPWRTP
jgi:hypothetical protein